MAWEGCRLPEVLLPPLHVGQTEEVTSHMAYLQQEPLKCAIMWWTNGRKREEEQFEHDEE